MPESVAPNDVEPPDESDALHPAAHAIATAAHTSLRVTRKSNSSSVQRSSTQRSCDAAGPDAPFAPGASITVRFGERVTEFEIVTCAEPSTVEWVERGQRRGWRTVFRLDPAGGANTSVTINNVWVPHSMGAWVRGRFFRRRDVSRQLEGMLENVLHALFRERPSF